MSNEGLQLFGDKALAKVFKELGDRVQRRVLRQAVNAGATPVVKAARSNVAKQSGLLKKSLGKKIKTFVDAGVVVAVIGPRTSVVGEYEGKKRWPAKYAHLIERGHINRDGSFTPPQPFLGPAYDQTEDQALDVIRSKLAEGVVKEASKSS